MKTFTFKDFKINTLEPEEVVHIFYKHARSKISSEVAAKKILSDLYYFNLSLKKQEDIYNVIEAYRVNYSNLSEHVEELISIIKRKDPLKNKSLDENDDFLCDPPIFPQGFIQPLNNSKFKLSNTNNEVNIDVQVLEDHLNGTIDLFTIYKNVFLIKNKVVNHSNFRKKTLIKEIIKKRTISQHLNINFVEFNNSITTYSLNGFFNNYGRLYKIVATL